MLPDKLKRPDLASRFGASWPWPKLGKPLFNGFSGPRAKNL